MNYEYEKNALVTASVCDTNAKLSLASTIGFLQEMITEYLGTMKSDNVTLKELNNCAWVFTKFNIHFNKFPDWATKLHMRSYTTSYKSIAINFQTTISENENPIIIANQEMCVIDLETRRIRRINSVSFPNDLEPAIEFRPTYSSYDLDNLEFVLDRNVVFSDLDYSRHVNNVSYIRFLADILGVEFFDLYDITDLEIHYKIESRLNDKLSFYKKNISDNEIQFVIKRDESILTIAIIKYTLKAR